MKQFALNVLSFLLVTTAVLAQTSALTICPQFEELDASQEKVINFASSLPQIGMMSYINWTTEDHIVNNGIISITLPDENAGKPINFELFDADFASETQYALYGRSKQGNISLYITPEGIGGTIDMVNKVYLALPIGGNKGALVQLSLQGNVEEACGTEHLESEEMTGYCNMDCGPAVLDVVALITPSARQWVNDTWGWLGQWFLFVETHNINGAFVNSLVLNKRVRVKIVDYDPDFVLTKNMLEDIKLFRNSITAIQAARINGADIRVLLTNEDYSNSSGVSGAIPADQGNPSTTNKIAIVEISSIGPISYTFAHEIAHHFGCWHSAPLLSSGCGNGYVLEESYRNTIMAVGVNFPPVFGGAPNFSRIQHFSNPDVLFGEEATGEIAVRDNAAQIRGAFCEVASQVPGHYTVRIEKNDPICVGDFVKFNAEVFEGVCFDQATLEYFSCASGPFQYEWRVSNSNNFNNSQVVSNGNV